MIEDLGNGKSGGRENEISIILSWLGPGKKYLPCAHPEMSDALILLASIRDEYNPPSTIVVADNFGIPLLTLKYHWEKNKVVAAMMYSNVMAVAAALSNSMSAATN